VVVCVCVRSVEDVRRGGGEEQGEEEDEMGVEKVCACLSCTKMYGGPVPH
jgi:hypothetical protein